MRVYEVEGGEVFVPPLTRLTWWVVVPVTVGFTHGYHCAAPTGLNS